MPCVCSTVCGQCLWDPLCLLGWFTPHSKQCHPLGCIASQHQVSSAGMGQPVHPHTHILMHMEWPVMHSPISPLMCCRAPLSCTSYSCAQTGTHTAVGDMPPLPCCATAPLALRSSPLLGTWPSAFHHGALCVVLGCPAPKPPPPPDTFPLPPPTLCVPMCTRAVMYAPCVLLFRAP